MGDAGHDLETERRLTQLEADQENHERTCAARWGLLLKVIGWGGSVAVTSILGVAAWGLVQVHDGQDRQLRMLEQLQRQLPAAAAHSPSPTPNPDPA